VLVLGQRLGAEPGFLIGQELLEELVDRLVWLAVFHRVLDSQDRLCGHPSYPKRPRRPRPWAMSRALRRLPEIENRPRPREAPPFLHSPGRVEPCKTAITSRDLPPTWGRTI